MSTLAFSGSLALTGHLAIVAGGAPGPMMVVAQGSDTPGWVLGFDSATGELLHSAGEDQGINDAPTCIACSPDGSLIAVSQQSNPFITFLDASTWDNAGITVPNAGSQVNSMAFSPDGAYLLCALQSSPYIAIYNTADWTKRSNPAVTPTGAAVTCAFSPNGNWAAIAHNTTPFVTIYTVSNWTKLSNPGTLPTGNASGCAWSPDSNQLVIGHFNSPFISVYTTDGITFTKEANPSPLPSAIAWAAQWNAAGTLLALRTGTTSPYAMVYDTSGGATGTWSLDASTEFDDAGLGSHLCWVNDPTVALWLDTYWVYPPPGYTGSQIPDAGDYSNAVSMALLPQG